ncbi:MAG: amidohydrolase [Phycisphaerales bacterium]|nr:amidohydrolase [Phycisphaerales bacterium]
MPDQGVFAHHAHVGPAEVLPEGTIDRLLRLLESCGIDRAVCFAPFPHQWGQREGNPNQWLAGELKTRPNLVGFGTLMPDEKTARQQVQEVVDLGFKGLKLHPQSQNFEILSPAGLAMYQSAQEAGLFVTFHCGVHAHRMKGMAVTDFDEVAHRFPALRFSLEHVGGYHFFNEALAVLFNNTPPPWNPGENRLYAGLSSVFTQHQNRFWYLSPQQIMELIAQVGIDQMIFGLDFPFNRERETMIALETIRTKLGLSLEDQRKVLGGNLRRVLGV